MASCPRLRTQRSFCRRAILRFRNDCYRRSIQYCDNGLPQAELLYYAKKKIGIGRVTVAATTAAGGPFFFDATEIRIGRSSVAAMTFRRRAILLADTMHCSDSQFQAQTCESMQQRGQKRGNPCIDSGFQAQTCKSMQQRGQNRGNPCIDS